MLWRWRAIHDAATRQSFCISPVFGSLHVWRSLLPQRRSPAHLTLVGCTAASYAPDAFNDNAEVVPPALLRRVEVDTAWSRFVRRSLKKTCLLGLIRAIEQNAARGRKRNGRTVFGANELNARWPYARGGECLPRALYRYRSGRLHGLNVALQLGVFPPTDRMHAWVSLDGVVIGEEPDEMLCFRPVLSFGAAAHAQH